MHCCSVLFFVLLSLSLGLGVAFQLQSSPPGRCLSTGAGALGFARTAGSAQDDLPLGVSVGTNGKFRARISVGGITKNLGYFDTLEEAGEAFNAAKCAPEGIEAYIATLTEKRKAQRGLPLGVSFHRTSGKYLSRIGIGGKKIHLGSFVKPEDAGEVYRSAMSAVEAFKKRKAQRGLPLGVSLHRTSGKYTAQICIGGNTTNLGYFNTPSEAVEAFGAAKSAPEGVESYIAALTEKRKTQRGFPTGVSFHKSSGRFQARISIDGKTKHLGLFSTPEEAAEYIRQWKSE